MPNKTVQELQDLKRKNGHLIDSVYQSNGGARFISVAISIQPAIESIQISSVEESQIDNYVDNAHCDVYLFLSPSDGSMLFRFSIKELETELKKNGLRRIK